MHTKAEMEGAPAAVEAEELFGLSNRCTFDINSLSGTLLMARGVVVQSFCLAQLLAQCGSG